MLIFLVLRLPNNLYFFKVSIESVNTMTLNCCYTLYANFDCICFFHELFMVAINTLLSILLGLFSVLCLSLCWFSNVSPWCSRYHCCTTSFNKAWTQVLRRFIATRGVSEIRYGEDLLQCSRLEIRLNNFRQSIIQQKQFIIIIIITIIIIIIEYIKTPPEILRKLRQKKWL